MRSMVAYDFSLSVDDGKTSIGLPRSIYRVEKKCCTLSILRLGLRNERVGIGGTTR